MEPPDEDPIDVASRFGIQPLLPDDFGDEALAGMKVVQLVTKVGKTMKNCRKQVWRRVW
jgi:hypothetical protein